MRILITGGDGFLGSNLVRILLEKGYAVRVLVHPGSTSVNLEGLSLDRRSGDIRDPEVVMEVMQGCDAVIHAAAMTDVWPSRNETLCRVNIEGTRNVIEAALATGIPRLVFVGSGSSMAHDYHEQQEDFGLDYIASKRKALLLVEEAVRTRQLPAMIILPTFMIGAYSAPTGTGKMICTLAAGQLRFYTRGGRNFVHVKDVATAVVNALTMGEIGKRYIAGNVNLTYRHFFATVARVVGRPAPRLRVPRWLILMVGRMGSIYGMLSGRPPLMSYPLARISMLDQFTGSTDAAQDLNMPATPIETAIRDCVDFYTVRGILLQKPGKRKTYELA
jgi:dihydroflavonol-4-reductase